MRDFAMRCTSPVAPTGVFCADRWMRAFLVYYFPFTRGGFSRRVGVCGVRRRHRGNVNRLKKKRPFESLRTVIV